jgi:hypothetical protein
MAVLAEPTTEVVDDRLAKHNTLVLAVAQALAGGNAGVIVTTGGIAGAILAPDPALATLPISVMVVGMWAGTLPVGVLAKAFGRRFVLQTGSVFGILSGEWWYVCELLKNGDQHSCRVKNGLEQIPGASDTRKERVVAENMLAKLEDTLGDLLGAMREPRARDEENFTDAAQHNKAKADILSALLHARAKGLKKTPKKRMENLENRITSIITLLPSLQQYRDGYLINFQILQIGAGIVDISPLPFAPTNAEDPGASPQVFSSDLLQRLKARADSTEDSRDSKLLKEAVAEIERLRSGAVIIRMPQLLQAWLKCLELVPRTKRGHPPKEWEKQIVWEAAMVAYRHADQDPSKAGENLFGNFVLEFYKIVTGTEAKGELTGIIEDLLAESKRPEHPGELSPMDYAKLRVSQIVLRDGKAAGLVPAPDGAE